MDVYFAKSPRTPSILRKKFRTLRSSTLQKKFNRTLWTPILQKKNPWSINFTKTLQKFVEYNFSTLCGRQFYKKPRSPLVLRKPSQALWNPFFKKTQALSRLTLRGRPFLQIGRKLCIE